jgi:DNA polymerase-4
MPTERPPRQPPEQPPERSILHVDMDAFFASIEQLDSPELAGKPVLVGGNGRRGVVAAASYEARVFGCRSAQPMSVARRLCPSAIVMPVRFARYREISDRMFSILERFTPLVEPLSIDEAFLDVTGTERLFGAPDRIAKMIKTQVRAELQLTASVGVAPNKFLAKLASDLNKPDGLTIIRADEIEQVLSPLPITRIWGIGPKTAAKLESLAIRTIADLRKYPAEFLQERFGIEADRYLRLGQGKDVREVTPDHSAKSIGQEQTFGEDLIDPEHVRSTLLGQCEQVARRLRRNNLRASRVTVKIRDGEFATCTRSATLSEGSDETRALWQAALGLFDGWAEKSFRPVRLIGMSTAQFSVGAGQLPLFPDLARDKQRKLDRALDQLTQKFGTPVVKRGRQSESNR